MQHRSRAFVLALALLGADVLSGQAEEGTVKATSAWHGQGQFFQVREQQALFVGAFSGTMFVETRHGPLDAAKMTCPGMVEVNLKDGKQSGEGRCIITARDGARCTPVGTARASIWRGVPAPLPCWAGPASSSA